MIQYIISEEELQQLKAQVSTFRSLQKQLESSLLCPCYMISTKFINEWKQYSGYANLWNHYKSQKTRKCPKPTYNEDLIVDQACCITSPDPKSPYHHETIDELNQSRCVIVSEEFMNIFENYNGNKIIRYPKLVHNKWVVDFSFVKMKFIVINKQVGSWLETGKQPSLALCQMSKYLNPSEFKQQISDYAISEYLHRGGYTPLPVLDPSRINLWVVEEQIFNHESGLQFKNTINSSGRVFGSKSTNINDVQQLQSYLLDSNIVFILEIVQDQKNRKQSMYSENDFEYQQGTENENGSGIANTSANLPIVGVGLKNTGNTCYMNCILQALVHAKQLKSYFANKSFKNQINKQNPHGTNGQLAGSFQRLLCSMMKIQSHGQFVDPSHIKTVVSHWNSIFKGHLQQDSQQFLLTFLDLIHEDLNRSTKKILEQVDQCKDQSGYKSWQVYHSNNNSIITDLFSGQYRSELTCNSCNHKKMIFEPFLNFSLQIPQKESNIKIVFCGYGRQRLYYQVELPIEQISVTSITRKLAQMLYKKYNPQRLRILNWRNDFTTVENLSQEKVLELLLKKEIICYQLSDQEVDILTKNEKEAYQILISFRRTGKQRQVPPNRPFWFTKDSTIKDIYRRIWLWIYKSSLEHKIDQSLRNQSQTTIFASFFLKSPPIQLSVIIKPEGKNAFYYQRQFPMNLRLFEAIDVCYGGSRCQLECNIDRLVQFCDTLIFGKVGTFQLETKVQGQLTLQQCISKFSAPQELNENNQLICEKCQSKVSMTKTITLNRTSKYLIIHLKRFKQRLAFRFKNSRFVNYPFNFNTENYINTKQQQAQYNLYAVVNHSGTLNSGHYTTYIRQSNSWYLCNDHIVSPVQEEDVINQNAYILFYQRKQ